MKPLFWVFLILSVIIQSTLTTIPLVFLTLLIITILTRQSWLYTLAFTAGIILDMMISKKVGGSSAYFVVFIFLVLSYQRKFEIQTPIFVIVSSFIGSLGYLVIFSDFDNILLQSFISGIIGLLMFKFFGKFNRNKYD